jgi:hypothetical protein
MATSEPLNTMWDSSAVQVASPSVNLVNLDLALVGFIGACGKVHKALFGKALEITSGNDGNHVPGSAHYKGKAVDLRSHDLLDDEQALFSLVLAHFARIYKVAVFDERFTAAPHWHVQTADSVGG